MKRLLIPILLLMLLCFNLGWYLGQYRESRGTIEVLVEVPVEVPVYIETLRVERQVEYVYGNPSELKEFDNPNQLREYVSWYRNERMKQYGEGKGVDYATDFMRQALADGFLVSTEIIYQEAEQKMFPSFWDMVNTAIIGLDIWTIDISSGTIKLSWKKG